MKTITTIIMATLILAFTSHAGSISNSSEYFICHFNDSISNSDIDELKQQGFQVFEKDTQNLVLYVKAQASARFTEYLIKRMKSLVQVDQNGQKTYIVEQVSESSPEFLKLFFNFI